MHSMTATHTTPERISRRGHQDSMVDRNLASVAPCLHVAVSRDNLGR